MSTAVLEQENTVVVSEEKNNYVSGSSTEIVAISTETGTIVTVSNNDTVLVESNNPTVVVHGIMGPPGKDGIAEEDMVYAKRIDFVTENEIIRAEAPVGTSESSASWRIRKIVIAGDNDITETWASGNANFDKIWTNRLTYTYS